MHDNNISVCEYVLSLLLNRQQAEHQEALESITEKCLAFEEELGQSGNHCYHLPWAKLWPWNGMTATVNVSIMQFVSKAQPLKGF